VAAAHRSEGRARWQAKPVEPKAIRHLSFDPGLYAQMLAGFQGAIADPKGTAYQAFKVFR